MATPAFANVVYHPSWRASRGLPPSRIRADLVTRVFYAFAVPNDDGTLKFLDEHADTELEVDVDWQCPNSAAQGTNYISLLHTLRRLLPHPRYLLTSALPSSSDCLSHVDLGAAGDCLDLFNLLFCSAAADGPEREEELHPCLLQSVDGGVRLLLDGGMPREKVLVGVPAFARYFPFARGPGQPFDKGSAGEVDYSHLPDEMRYRPSVDEDTVAAYYADHADWALVSFDVPETVRQKAEYVRSMGLGGLFFCHGVGDHEQGRYSLVAAGAEGLLGKPEATRGAACKRRKETRGGISGQ
ncbi:hypothetical protein NKR23_g2960 [Pleurostoma richardsiae]|uniref:chitinase n=1 Tax=Pleurostoma richardsiae TaxID=41990 RepID=A0AA38S0K0_9PEZI|nr:hypothetical protein NKR23_g2960 [Pleurostoma richardsiae]